MVVVVRGGGGRGRSLSYLVGGGGVAGVPLVLFISHNNKLLVNA